MTAMVLRMHSPVAFLGTLIRRQNLILELTAREIRTRIIGSALGKLWLILQPLLMLCVYALVFGLILGPRGAGDSSTQEVAGSLFIANLFCGVIVFSAFSEPISRSAKLVLSRPNYVKKVVFPLEILPVPVIASSWLNVLVGFVMLALFEIIWLGQLPWTIVLVPLIFVPLGAMVLGLSLALSAIGVFLRDVQEIVRVLVQALFFLSPVVWTADFAPPSIRSYAALNPLFGLIESTRSLVIKGEIPEALPLLTLLLVSLLILWIGYSFFQSVRQGFADVL